MPEWWTYSLSDFLLFSPRTYYRLIERHNVALWPAHVATLAAGALVALLLGRGTAGRSRLAAAILAILWAWVGWTFVARRYASINWAATYLAWLFVVEVVLLGWLVAALGRVRLGWRRGAQGVVGAMLFLLALALYPALAPALGRGWFQAEVFGIMPDPTVLGTLGALWPAEGPPRLRWALLAPPLIWCLVSGATLLAMSSAGG